MRGSLRVEGGRLRGLQFLGQLASIARKDSHADLELNKCEAELFWGKGAGELKQIEIAAKGKFRIEGSVSLHDQSLGGQLRLGLAPAYLEWLPKAEEVFTRNQDGYLWTTVHLSGTLDAPQQDLSPRVLAALKETPDAFFAAAFRWLGEWIRGDSKRDK